MKNIIVLITLAIALCFTTHTSAQISPKTELTSVKQTGKTVSFTITAPKPFIYGSNRYILYIGDKIFFQHKQQTKKGKGILIFAVPSVDLSNISDGAKMFITYGDINGGGHELEEAALQDSKHCAALGKLNKKLTTK